MSAQGTAQHSQRRGYSGKSVLVALLLATLLAGFAAWLLYQRFVHYERQALRHVPANAGVVLATNLTMARFYAPFREFFLPLASWGEPSSLKPRLERLKHHSRLELAVDLRELMFATGPKAGSWLLVLAGKFPQAGMLDGIQATFEEEGVTARRDGEFLVFDRGVVATQAPDGPLLIASERSLAQSAHLETDRFHALGLSQDEPMTFLATARGFAGVGIGVEREPQDWGVVGTVSLKPMQISWKARSEAGLDEVSAQRHTRVFADLLKVLPERPVKGEGSGAPLVLDLTQESLSQLASRLGQGLRDILGRSWRPPTGEPGSQNGQK